MSRKWGCGDYRYFRYRYFARSVSKGEYGGHCRKLSWMHRRQFSRRFLILRTGGTGHWKGQYEPQTSVKLQTRSYLIVSSKLVSTCTMFTSTIDRQYAGIISLSRSSSCNGHITFLIIPCTKQNSFHFSNHVFLDSS